MADAFISGLCERVAQAAATRTALRIRGGGTKDFYGQAPTGEPLDVAAHAGIVAYEPRELVLTVKAGTPVDLIEGALAAERQMLPFEPPRFDGGSGRATIGGVVATGFSGPRRPYTGATRDFVLGARIINGKGEDLSFGGRVIKNVAGYDVSRLMTGALGTLGILTEISFKVLPRPVQEATLAYELDQAAAIVEANRWAGQPLPLSATAWHAGRLHVRLSGAPPAVAAARKRMGGEEIADAASFWEDLREHRHAFFAGDAPLWRLSVPQTTLPLELADATLIEWGGGLRWIRGESDAFAIRSSMDVVGGHATLFRTTGARTAVFHPLAPALMKIHRRLKQAFDPAGILNPGRFHDF